METLYHICMVPVCVVFGGSIFLLHYTLNTVMLVNVSRQKWQINIILMLVCACECVLVFQTTRSHDICQIPHATRAQVNAPLGPPQY